MVPGGGYARLAMARSAPDGFDPQGRGEVRTATGTTVYRGFHDDPGVHGEPSAPVRVCGSAAGAPAVSVPPGG
ncbi:hypothetical protein [Nocardiopsis sp. CC223A]|uniref:hypothetical protein n=1 Tax=Nocardiopsis sp. CC223A TaxID=3044051 RepID=UPI00278C0E54|nr:hypothetical protein [Nocardiopsis sp. CC223A]